MAYHYSSDDREDDQYSLPDFEVFELTAADVAAGEGVSSGFFYAFGSPGCLWDSDPVGPFATYQAALDAAREAASE